MTDYRSIERGLRRQSGVHDLGEDELYLMIPGKDVARVAAAAQTIASATLKLSDYHRERRRAPATE